MNKFLTAIKKWFWYVPYQDNPKSYAYGRNPYKLMWLFVIGSFLGYLLETLWYLCLRGSFINRQGVLFGPFSPIYGVAFAGMIVVFYKYRNMNALHIFILSSLIGGAFEYICGFLQEQVLGTRSWDYSNQYFQLHGRICLKMALLWGILGLIFLRITYPFLSRYIEAIPKKAGKRLAIICFSILVADCILSLGVCIRQRDRRMGIEPHNRVESLIDSYYTDERLQHIYTEIRIVEPVH